MIIQEDEAPEFYQGEQICQGGFFLPNFPPHRLFQFCGFYLKRVQN
jgi:hypothetical protein